MQRSLIPALVLGALDISDAVRTRALGTYIEDGEVKTAAAAPEVNPLAATMKVIPHGTVLGTVEDPTIGPMVVVADGVDIADPVIQAAIKKFVEIGAFDETMYAGNTGTKVLVLSGSSERPLHETAIKAVSVTRAYETTMLLTPNGLFNPATLGNVNSFSDMGIEGEPVNIFAGKVDRTFVVNFRVEGKGYKPAAFDIQGNPAAFGDEYLDGMSADEYLPAPLVKVRDGDYVFEVTPTLQGIDVDAVNDESIWVPFMALNRVRTEDGFNFTLTTEGEVTSEGNISGSARTFDATTDGSNAAVDEVEAQADDGTDGSDADEVDPTQVDTLDHTENPGADEVGTETATK